MNIEKVASPEDTPAPFARVDYPEIAAKYNELERGQALRLSKLSNVTHFKQALGRRGLKEGVDYEARQRGRFCFLKRISRKLMSQ